MKSVKKIETKLFMQFIILVTIPMMMMGVISYNIYIKGEQLRNEIILQRYNEALKSEYGNIFDSIRKYYINFTNGKNYRWLEQQESPPYYNYNNLSSAIDEISGGYIINKYVKNYKYISVRNEWVMSKNGIFDYSKLYNKEQIEEFILQQKDVIDDIYWINNTEFPDQNNEGPNSSYLFDLKGQFLIIKNQNINKEIISILMIELDVERLEEVTLTYTKLGYETMILSNDKILLSTSYDFFEAYNNNNFIEDDIVLDKNLNTYKIIETKTPNDNMKYILAYNTNRNSAGADIFIYMAIIIILIYVLILLVLRSLASYVSKPFRFMQEKSAKNLLEIKRQFVHNLALGVIDQERIDKILSEIDIEETSTYKVILIKFESEANSNINEVINELLQNNNIKSFIAPVKVKGMLLFVAGSRNYYLLEKKVAKIYAEIKSILDKHEDIISITGISDSISKLIYINQGYNQCLEAINNNRKDDINQNFSINIYNEKKIISTDNAYDIIIENELIDLIERCSKGDEIKKILNIVISRIEERCSFDFEKNYSFSKLIITITNIPIKHGISLYYVYNMPQEDIFKKVNQINQKEELIIYFEESIIRPIINSLLQYKEENKDDIISNMIKLINESKGCITLNECAEKLNYSSTYLGKALIQCKGMSFTDLCNNEKLKYAKYLLLTTDNSVNEISEKLGYTNVQNFIRFFKKQTEMTPLSFRKENDNHKIK